MGGSESKPIVKPLPPVCNIKRASFQKKLLDINAAYSIMNHYYLILKKADQENNGKPPKQLGDRDTKNFNDEVIARLKKRAAASADSDLDFELFTYLQTFEMRYNDLENDVARKQLLHNVIGKAYEVLQLFTKNLYMLCEEPTLLDEYDEPIDDIESNNLPEVSDTKLQKE